MADTKTEYGTVVSQDDVELDGADEQTTSNPQMLEVSLRRIVLLVIGLSPPDRLP